MSESKPSKGEVKIIKAGHLRPKDAAAATGLSYGYCRKVLSNQFVKDAINAKINPGQKDNICDQKVDKRIGNQFWKARSSHGRNPKFSSPEQLWEAALEYFQWVEDNPLNEEKLFCYQGNITRDTVYKMRAMTIDGLCIFLDIGESTWNDYCHKDDFSGVTTRIDKVIRSQKFSGAAADLLNANIIARDLGLKDKKEVSGDPKNPIRTINTDMSAEEAADVYNSMLD
jgi:hypothetical protein